MPPVNAGWENRCGGTIGLSSSIRFSHNANATISSTPAASVRNVHAGQPLSCPSISGTSTAISPAVSSTSPTKSYPSLAFPSAPAGRIFAAAISAMTPIGMLTQKTSRHPFSSPNASMISPPRIGPSAVETPMTDPRIANAFPRTGPGNSSWMNAVTAGTNMPPARPCTTRATISCRLFCASPQNRLATVNSSNPVKNTHLCPTRSPIRPAGISAIPNASA